MKFLFASQRFSSKAILASALIATCGAAPAAAPIQASAPVGVPRRAGIARPLQTSGAWVIRDLGASRTPGAPPSALVLNPYAIDRHGDVALAACPIADCYAAAPSNIDAYVYDYRSATLIALAKFPTSSRAAAVQQYVPRALNDRGQIVGAVVHFGRKTESKPVIWTRVGATGSTIARLDSTPGDQGTAFGINNFGVSVGTSYTGPYQPNSFEGGSAVRFTGAAPILLGANVSGGHGSDAFAINDAGVAVGDAGYGTAVVFQGGIATPISQQIQCAPGSGTCFDNLAVAINAGGDVIGNYGAYYFDMATYNYVGFVWSNNAFSTLAPSCGFNDGCPISYQPNDSDYVVALNDNDDFVGSFDGQPWVSFSPTGDANGLLPPNSGWRITNVTALNDARQIVGQGYRAGFGTQLRAFLLQPPR